MSESNDGGIPFFDYGEWVQSALTDEYGIVVGSDIHGLIYTVQLAGTGLLKNFHGVTLHVLPERAEPEAHHADNVIDFTQAVDLRRAKARGAA